MSLLPGEIHVDLFAGGGGASTGAERAFGRPADIAINHDPEALAIYAANHPGTRLFCEDVRDVQPRFAVGARKVGYLHASPDCTFFSKARGAKPHRDRNRARRRRGLAGIVLKWAEQVRPRVITVENVEEFEDWGPLGEDGQPDPTRKGESFRRWVARLRNLGYVVEWRELRASDYGAPTSRKRLFIIARCDGQPIVWPERTHGPGRAHPFRTAAECIDWSIPCPSIFLSPTEAKKLGIRRPLADATLARIARGVRRYVIEAAQPFIVRTAHGEVDKNGKKRRDRGEHTIVLPLPTVTAFLAKHYDGPRESTGQQMEMPIGTVTGVDHHSLVTSHLLKLRGGLADHHTTAQAMGEPAPTITASGTHLAEVRAFLIATVTTHDRFGLVTVHGELYQIADIGMRMLTPRELFSAQGFPADYVIDPIVDGKRLTKTTQVHKCGNSVPPPFTEAIVRANFADAAAREAVA